MNRIDFTIEWFHKENDRQISLNNSLSTPIGILTGLFALFFYMFTSFSFKSELHFYIEFSFVLFILLSLLFWALVVFYLFKSYDNLFKTYEYKAIPYPSDLNDQYKKLEKYVEENKDLLDAKVNVDTLYEEQLIDMFSEYLNRNIENNDKKSKNLHIAKKLLLLCIISSFLCAIPFIFHFVSIKEIEKVQKVEIENITGLKGKLNDLEIKNLIIESYVQEQCSTKADTAAAAAAAASKTN